MKYDGPVAVYRHFDAKGALLYIGQSNSPSSRPEQLCRGGAEWAYQVATITVAWFPDRETAVIEEARAIRTENPRHNMTHSSSRAVRRPNQGGRVLRHWMNQHDMTVENLSVLLDRPQKWVRAVLDDKVRPTGKSADKIEEATGLSSLVFCRGGVFPIYARLSDVSRARSQLADAGIYPVPGEAA